MKVMEEQWIKELRERFADREQPAPDGLWEGIEAAMARQGLGSDGAGKPEHRARVVPFGVRRMAVAAACLIIIIGVTGYFSYRLNGGRAAVAVLEGGGTPAATGGDAATGATGTVGVDDVTSVLSVRNTTRLTAMAGRLADSKRAVIEEESLALTAENGAAETETVAAAAQNDTDSTPARRDLNRYKPHKERPQSGQFTSVAVHKVRKTAVSGGFDGVSVGVYGMGLTAMGNASAAGNSSYYNGGMQSMADFTSDATLTTTPVYSTDLNRMSADKVRVKHRQPVKAGVSARFLLTDRLGVESGLYYSYLSSDFNRGDETYGTVTRQRLHYIGLPVRLTCSMWRNCGLDIYAGAGGAVELGVSGTSATDSYIDGRVENTTDESVKDSRPQFSVNASAGVQYNLSSAIGVYAEPGVSYYIDNGSSVQNFYKDKPWSFSLSLGLRLILK